MAKTKDLKVAIVHDWLVGGGAERVVYELHQMFPEAPIYTSYCTREWRKRLDGRVKTGYLQYWPFSRLRKFLPVLRIWWFGRLNLSGYDLVISSSGNGEAMGVKVPENTIHICYCHAPTHYYWRHYEQYMKRPGFGLFDPLARWGLKTLVGPLRKWDLAASKGPAALIANSTHTKNEIKTFYGRDSKVVHPPVDVERFSPDAGAKDRIGFVTAGRQTPYKRTDIIIQACTELRLPLTVIGRGPEHDRLVRMAGPTIRFRTDVSDEEMPRLLASAEAFLFAAYEDFGITPVEAMAAGTPVIAYAAGGALDYVVPGTTGEFFNKQTPESLIAALERFNAKTYNAKTIAEAAAEFSSKKFRSRMQAAITKSLK